MTRRIAVLVAILTLVGCGSSTPTATITGQAAFTVDSPAPGAVGCKTPALGSGRAPARSPVVRDNAVAPARQRPSQPP
jgi:hypothetical protein